ncbi:hypothetical protein, partial [Klebsiella variicola]|uniref:hypothetical protein n=1 Tax=Klebsiella variicola TaxID=244366 RepID=UPI0027314309
GSSPNPRTPLGVVTLNDVAALAALPQVKRIMPVNGSKGRLWGLLVAASLGMAGQVHAACSVVATSPASFGSVSSMS